MVPRTLKKQTSIAKPIAASAAATVNIKRVYPIFIDAINNSKVSVGPPYFEAVFIPLMVPAILLCAFNQSRLVITLLHHD